MTPLTIYLRTHQAVARTSVDLFRRTAASQADRPYGPELAALAEEDREDYEALRRLWQALGVKPDLPLRAVVMVGERLGRLKPNGRLIRRAALSDLFEVEALFDAAHAKAAVWQALDAAGVSGGGVDPAVYYRRAEDQKVRLTAAHRTAAAVLRRDRP